MKELVNRLNEARKAYYEGESIMSDKEYDNLYDKLGQDGTNNRSCPS